MSVLHLLSKEGDVKVEWDPKLAEIGDPEALAATLAMGILSLFTFAAHQGSLVLGKTMVLGRVIDWRKVCAYVNAYGHFSDFAKGSINLASVVFFLTGTALFLFLAVKVLESRRWR